jgi:hypothetical protein
MLVSVGCSTSGASVIATPSGVGEGSTVKVPASPQAISINAENINNEPNMIKNRYIFISSLLLSPQNPKCSTILWFKYCEKSYNPEDIYRITLIST